MASEKGAAAAADALPLRLVFALKPFAHTLFFPGHSIIVIDAETRQEVCVVEPCGDHVAGDVIRVRRRRAGADADAGRGRGRHRGSGPARRGAGDLLLREEFGWCQPSMPVVFIDEPGNAQVALMASDTPCYGYLALCGRGLFAHASRVYLLEPTVDAGARPGCYHDPNSRRGGSLTRKEREVEEMKRAGSMSHESPAYVTEQRRGELCVYRLAYAADGSTGSGPAGDAPPSARTPDRLLAARMRRIRSAESPLVGAPWNVPLDWEHIEIAVGDGVDLLHAVAMLMNAKREAHCCLGCSHIGMMGLGGMGGRRFL